jgi:hypothetical protein
MHAVLVPRIVVELRAASGTFHAPQVTKRPYIIYFNITCYSMCYAEQHIAC